MENQGQQFELPKFSSPEEELKYLRERVARQEQAHWQEQTPANKEAIISRTITEYAKEPAATRLEEHLIIENPQFEQVLEHLGSLPHREKVRELYRVIPEKGILSAIKVAQALKNPHIEDDFHRVLVEYVKTGAAVPGLDRERDLSKLLKMTLFEVTLPFSGGIDGRSANHKEIISAMERLFAGMLPPGGVYSPSYGHFSLEIVQSNFSHDIVLYVAVEEQMKDLFIKQLIGAFPAARIEECSGDYNIFNEFGTASASSGQFLEPFAFPLSYMDDAQSDPVGVLLNSFTKLERDGEGAAIQFIIAPDVDKLPSKLTLAKGQIAQGVSVKKSVDIPLTMGATAFKLVQSLFSSSPPPKKDAPPDPRKVEEGQKATALIDEKLKAPLMRMSLRIVASAASKERADAIRLSLESAFTQYARPQSNGLKFAPAQGARLERLLHDFTFRGIGEEDVLVVNTKELAAIYHFPASLSQKDAPQLKSVHASTAPAPAEIPHDGIILGVNKHRGESHEIRMRTEDRLRHMYVIGQTGTGKTKLLKNMIIQDIENGDGVCFIDPHGNDIEAILANIPKERIEDVIYFDPSAMERPFGLNMLEYDQAKPEQKIFVVNEMLSIFHKLYAAGNPESMGPAFEQYFRNSTMLVMEDPETGSTLLEIPRVMADANFRNLKLSRCKNPLVVQFWRDIATKTSGEAGLANMIPYITNKFDVFLQNDIMRPIIAQEKSSLNFREIMDNKKILLVNLSKGRLGEINAHLLGLVLVGKILMAAMSRVDSIGKQLPNFYLYIDEFQNVTTDSISAILSEARKYGLSLTIAHQFLGQLEDSIKNAVFGNVGNMVIHRVGAEDAEFLKPHFAPTFTSEDIIKLDNHNAYVKLLFSGKPTPPFNIETGFHPKGHPEIVESLKQLSSLKFGRDRKLVDDAIMRKYLTASQRPSTVAASAPATPQARPAPTTAPLPAAAPQTPANAPGATPFAQAFSRASIGGAGDAVTLADGQGTSATIPEATPVAQATLNPAVAQAASPATTKVSPAPVSPPVPVAVPTQVSAASPSTVTRTADPYREQV